MKRFLPYILMWVLLAACTSDSVWFDESEWVPLLQQRYIYMPPKSISIKAEAKSFDTYVEAKSTPWQFSGYASWLTVNPQMGTDATKVTIAAAENMSGENLRTSLFWLSSAVSDYDYKAMVSVTQQAATPYLTISEPTLTMAAKGETKSIAVDTNISYTISKSSSATWLTVEASEDSTRLTITVEPNPVTEARNASITLSGLRTQVINLTQEAACITSTEYGPLQVGVKGADYALQITSDFDWTASASASWLMVCPAEGAAGTSEVVLSVSPNNSTSARNGWVDFKIGSEDMFSVIVNQEALYCTVSSTSLSLEAAGGSGTITVSSNTEWSIISKPSWITADVGSGSGNATVAITVSEHTGREPRYGEICIGVEGITDLVHSVYVSQSQHYFNLSSMAFAMLPSSGGTHKVNVVSDDKWSIEKEGSWLALSSETGAGDMEVTMTAADNPSIKRRSSKVLFTPTYATPVELIINQGARYLSVDAAEIVFYWYGGESLPVAVTTDGTFSVTTQCEWLEIERSGHSFTLMAKQSDIDEPRSAVVTVALTGLVDGEAYSIDIPVVQRPYLPVGIITFPKDQNWDVIGDDNVSVVIAGFTTDESWYELGGSSLEVHISAFGNDEDWNQE